MAWCEANGVHFLFGLAKTAAPAVREAYLGAGEQADRGRERALPARDAPLLTVHSLTAGYGAATVVRDAAPEVAEGELVAVLGANGAGKTTLMRALSGLIRPVAGGCVSRTAHDQSPGIAIAPRGPHLSPRAVRFSWAVRHRQSARRRLCAPIRRRGGLDRRAARALRRSSGVTSARAFSRVESSRCWRSPAGSWRGRSSHADEPSLGLAPKLLEVLYDLLAELREEGTTILLVDQMATLALSVADRAYVLQSGTIKHSGSAREVAEDPALMRAYLGDHGTAR